jgi:hypothetical protein
VKERDEEEKAFKGLTADFEERVCESKNVQREIKSQGRSTL